MKNSKLYLGYGGHCFAKAKHVVKNDPNKEIKFHALFGLIQHEEKGWVLFDTAYTNRFFEATKSYPNKIYAKLTKVFIDTSDHVSNQIRNFGIEPDQVEHIIISHFHADHIGGLKDFKNAKFYCSKIAYQHMTKTNKFTAFTKGILHDLIPDNFSRKVIFIEDYARKIKDDDFGHRYDLFNDQSIYTYDLPGHAAGQIGIQVQTKKDNYFLIADACWDQRAFKDEALPSKIVKLFFDSWQDYILSIDKISKFHIKYPKTIIVPTHCKSTTDKLISRNFDLDAL
tara:strand:+ start:1379 stop:2227 length:849 start_codon:yes stop_codon:yes gene_type:complete